MDKTEEKIINQITSKYEYWRSYVKVYEEKAKDIDANKKTIYEQLKKDPFDQSIQSQYEFLVYEANFMIKDMDKLVMDFLSLYKLSLSLGIEENIDEDIRKNIDNILQSEPKAMFVVTDGKLEERVEGDKQKFISSLKESPMYKQIEQTLLTNLQS